MFNLKKYLIADFLLACSLLPLMFLYENLVTPIIIFAIIWEISMLSWWLVSWSKAVSN